MGGAHLRPLGMDSHKGSLGRNVSRARREIRLSFSNDPKQKSDNMGKQKKYSFETT